MPAGPPAGRSLGGACRLTAQVADGPLGGQSIGAGGGVSSLTPEVLAGLPAPVQSAIADAFAAALPPIYLYAVPIMLAGAVLALFIQARPLSDTAPGVATRAEPVETPV